MLAYNTYNSVSCIWNHQHAYRIGEILCLFVDQFPWNTPDFADATSSCYFCFNRLRFGEIHRRKLIQLVFNMQSGAEKISVFHCSNSVRRVTFRLAEKIFFGWWDFIFCGHFIIHLLRKAYLKKYTTCTTENVESESSGLKSRCLARWNSGALHLEVRRIMAEDLLFHS